MVIDVDTKSIGPYKRLERKLANTEYEIVAEDWPFTKLNIVHHYLGQPNERILPLIEFFYFKPKDYYIHCPGQSLIYAKNTNNRRFDRLYAHVSICGVFNGKILNVREEFINIGGLVPTCYDISKDGIANQIVIPYKFNIDLEAYSYPWVMLTEYLAGKKVIAETSTDTRWFQRIENGRPILNEYRLSTYLKFDFTD